MIDIASGVGEDEIVDIRIGEGAVCVLEKAEGEESDAKKDGEGKDFGWCPDIQCHLG